MQHSRNSDGQHADAIVTIVTFGAFTAIQSGQSACVHACTYTCAFVFISYLSFAQLNIMTTDMKGPLVVLNPSFSKSEINKHLSLSSNIQNISWAVPGLHKQPVFVNPICSAQTLKCVLAVLRYKACFLF